MTLLAALGGRDGAVLAADSRAVFNEAPRRVADDTRAKLSRLNRWCGVGASGAAGISTYLMDSLKKRLEREEPRYVDGMAQLLHEHFREKFSAWFGTRQWVAPKGHEDQRPHVSFVLAGYTASSHLQEGLKIYTLSSGFDFAPQRSPNGRALSGARTYATYLLRRLHSNELDVDRLALLAAYIIEETAQQHPEVGGPPRIAKIRQGTGYLELEPDEVAALIKRNDTFNQYLRYYFYAETRPCADAPGNTREPSPTRSTHVAKEEVPF